MEERESTTIRSAVVRIERSAWKLKVEKDRSITEIGIDYGYSASNFATAFKKHLNISPTDFRKTSEQLVEKSSFSHGISMDDIEDSGKRITIEYLDSMLVVYERKKGNYHNLPNEWCEFIEKYAYLASEDTLYIEGTIDDPSITDEDSCMFVSNLEKCDKPHFSNLHSHHSVQFSSFNSFTLSNSFVLFVTTV